MTRIRCPHCGHETAKIIYGIPQMTDQLQKDIDDHKVYLAGCERMIPPPSRYCFHCKQGVCYTFFPVEEMETTKVEFEIGGYFQGYKRLVVEGKDNSYFATYYPSHCEDILEKRITLTSDQYKKFVHKVYMSYIKEWDEFYDNRDILDGTSWQITITYGNYQREWSGNNVYPPSWNRFIKAINSLDLPTIK
ncbi:hypothetical protein [Holdemanella biformis]